MKIALQGFGKANKGKRADFDLKHTATRPLLPGSDVDSVIRVWQFIRAEFQRFCKRTRRSEVTYQKQNFSTAISSFCKGASRILEGKTKSDSKKLPILQSANAKLIKSYTLYRLRHTYFTTAFAHYKSHPGMSIQAFLNSSLTGWTGKNLGQLSLSYSDMIVKKEDGSNDLKLISDRLDLIENKMNDLTSSVSSRKRKTAEVAQERPVMKRARSRPALNAGLLTDARVRKLYELKFEEKIYDLSGIRDNGHDMYKMVTEAIRILKKMRPGKRPSVNLIKSLVGGNGTETGKIIKELNQ